MKIWAALSEALKGWIGIIRGEAGWERHFSLSLPGLVTALVIFVFFALLSVAIASANVGMPSLEGALAALFVQSLSILALLAGVLLTRRAVPSEAPLLRLLVPGLYALIAYLIAGTLVSLVAGVLLMALWACLAFLFFCLGRRAGNWTRGVSAGFAVLTMVLLVGMPVTLYMLLGPVAAPTS